MRGCNLVTQEHHHQGLTTLHCLMQVLGTTPRFCLPRSQQCTIPCIYQKSQMLPLYHIQKAIWQNRAKDSKLYHLDSCLTKQSLYLLSIIIYVYLFNQYLQCNVQNNLSSYNKVSIIIMTGYLDRMLNCSAYVCDTMLKIFVREFSVLLICLKSPETTMTKNFSGQSISLSLSSSLTWVGGVQVTHASLTTKTIHKEFFNYQYQSLITQQYYITKLIIPP